ncbi:hypothetical protein [Streptomyces sp. G7(2002)]|nr:hypothetical protein [Streptomyces sp. G7(2002)]WDT52593.1 hypothetical protein NUT86_00220 [Streptomyces sp. G7(2002)]
MREEEVTHDDFRTFLAAPPLKGLGASEGIICRVVDHDIALLDRHFA